MEKKNLYFEVKSEGLSYTVEFRATFPRQPGTQQLGVSPAKPERRWCSWQARRQQGSPTTFASPPKAQGQR